MQQPNTHSHYITRYRLALEQGTSRAVLPISLCISCIQLSIHSLHKPHVRHYPVVRENMFIDWPLDLDCGKSYTFAHLQRVGGAVTVRIIRYKNSKITRKFSRPPAVLIL